MHTTAILSVAAALLLSGCGITESRVRQQITESEARTASAQTQLEDRMLDRFKRAEQTLAGETDRLRREAESRTEADRRMLADLLRQQRDALLAQVRVLDEAISAYAAARPVALAPR
jgi:hypothetical protein